MVMEKWNILAVVALLCMVECKGNTFEFLYNENNGYGSEDIAQLNVTLNGSYASLGNWPHWCLGNLLKCGAGITVDIWLKFTEINDNSSDIIVFTSGGHNFHSNGVYLLQRYGDEYEFGVSYQDSIWTLGFRVIPELWINIHATWDLIFGLIVSVDGARHENSDPSNRDYQQLLFDVFNEVVIGLNVDGTQHTEDSRFEIAKLSVFDWSGSAPSTTDIDSQLLWMGCNEISPTQITPMIELSTAVYDCRAICASTGKPIAAMLSLDQCACVELEHLTAAKLDRNECVSMVDWDFYRVLSGLASEDSDFSITVTVHKLGDKDYVIPFESVAINIETNFDINVPFTVDFGDGTIIELEGKTVSYFWITEGTYDIEVQTEIGIAKVSGSTTFTIKNVDEGYAGDFVMLNAFQSNETNVAFLDFTSIDYATGACNIKYGDISTENDLSLTNLDKYVENSHLMNTFSNFGQYNLSVDCMNRYGAIRNNTLFTSQKFETTYHFHEVGLNFTTTMAGDQQFYTDVKVDHNDPNLNVTLHQNMSTQIVDSGFLRIHENYLTYNYDDIVIDRRIISVQNQIKKPEIFSQVIDGAWNLTTNITVRIPPGNDMFLNVSFSAGEDQTFYIHQLKYQSDIVFEIMFPILGYYPVLVNISNDISFNTADLLVSVEVPIRTISLSIANIVDKVNPIELNIDLNENMQGPAKVNFEIDHGNGFVNTHFLYSDTYFFSKYEHNFVYADWGTYDICVRAYNRISSVSDCITVQIGQKIKYVDVLMPSSGRFEVNETAKAIIRCPKGSDKIYIVQFGDGETFVFTDQYLKDTENFEAETTTEVPATTEISSTNLIMTTDSFSNQTEHSTTASYGLYLNITSNATTESTASSMSSTAGVSSTSSTTDTANQRRRRNADGNADATTTPNSMNGTTEGTVQTTNTHSDSQSITVSADFINSTESYNQSVNNNTTSSGNASYSANMTSQSGNLTALNETTPMAIETTTTEMPTTTTVIITTTMEPIPDDATDPVSSNFSTARRRRDGTIEVCHRYQAVGTYTVKVKAVNHFNWVKDTLCPQVIVAEETQSNASCEKQKIILKPNFRSSFKRPLQFFRSDQINLTASVTLHGCDTSKPTYSWRTSKLVQEDGKTIQRPYHGAGICLQEQNENIFRYDRSSLPFGLYKVTLTVSPSGHPLKTTMQHFYMQVNPSAPHAVIEGNDEHLWFLVYGTTMIKFRQSIDPDFHNSEGIEYDLICMSESELPDLKSESRDTLVSRSELVAEGITHKYTSKNPIRVYEYSSCFETSGNFTRDIRFPNGELNVPSEYFVSDVSSFAIMLFVSKNNLTTMTEVTFEIRLSNASNLLDQLDDLLASKDTTGVMRAVEALSSLIVTPTNASEDEEFEAKEQLSQLKDKLIGALDSVSGGVKDIEQASGMLGLVDDLTKDATSVSDSARIGATSAIKNSATVTEEFADEPLDTLTNVGSKVVSGVSNVLPKEDETAKKLKEHEKNLATAEHDAKVALGPSEDEEEEDGEDGADIILEEDEEPLTELTEEDLASTAPLPYNKLLKKCDLLHSAPLDKLYKYIFFYESIFRVVIKNRSEEIMISSDILKMARNDIFCYIGILEEPADIEWYVNRFCDVEKRRRDLVRKNADRDVSKSFLGAIDSVSGVLLNKTKGNETVELNAPGLKVAMKKASGNDTEDDGPMEGAGVKMPASLLAGSGNDSEVGTTMIVNDQSPFTYANENDTTEVGTSVVTFKLSTPGTKDEIGVSNTTEPIEIYLAGNPENVQSPQLNTLIEENGDAASKMNYHSINVTKNDTTLHILVRPQFSISDDLFDILIQYEDYPNETHYMEMTTLPLPEESIRANLSWEQTDVLRHTFYPDANNTKLAGIYKIGVRVRSGKIDFQSETTAFNYTWQMFLGGCRFWNAENETWDSDGCVVGNLTTYNATQCLCTHLTSFGGEMVVPPNTIDFNNVWAKFKNLNENAAVFSTVVSLLGVYVILLIWARHMDKKDIIKWGATPLEDNLPTDNYHYQLSVFTGMKKNSGTQSNISLIISGETTDTGVRLLFDGKRKSHAHGSIMNYILSVEEKLGPLSFCRIWHDNTGEGNHRSWYLDQIECTDLQSGERYFFLCNRWLACEEDDGMVDRILPVAGIEDLVAFKQLFSSSVRKKLTSDHLWLSVFSRPTRSLFTRVQRISCCMSLLFLTMITNAMWFKGDSESEKTNQKAVSLKIGPISFTLAQVFISFASTVIVFPPSFMLVTLFRRTKQKKNTVMQVNQNKPKRGKWKNLGGSSGTRSATNMWGDEPKTSRFRKFKESVQELVKGSNKNKYNTTAEDDEEFDSIPQATIAGDTSSKKKQKAKKKPYMFPHWCSYIAWILCFFSIITPAFFTILYSMEWGATKANQWLTTFVLSFFQSVIVVQPIKVLCLVAFIACVLKKPDLDEEGDCTNELNNAIAAHDEELMTKGSDVIDEIAKRRKQANEALEPPDTEKLEKSRQARLLEMKMEQIVKEIALYGFFVMVLFFLSYQQRDMDSYNYTTNLKNMFLGNFEKITTVLEYWKWIETIFLPTLYAAKYHNGTELVKWWDKRCLNDFETRRMGIARMRQLRIKEDSCTIVKQLQPVINHCRNDYNWYDDDTKAYLAGWKETSKENRTILNDLDDIDPWVYQNSYRLANAPYVATLATYKGGGYVINFERSYRRTKRNLTRLRSEDWLDLRTRALLLEFTVYNPNSNLFASVILTTEFPATGAAVPRSEIKVFRLQSYVGGFAIVVIFFEVLYCCFAIFFFVRCIKKVKKDKCKYFRTFWDILEFVLLCFAVACIAMYAFKHILTEVAFHSLKKQSKAEYVNFQSLAMYDELYGYMTAIVVFLASITFLKLLQFNKKMNMLGDTVKLATKDLKVFSIAFILYFMAFVITAYLLFGQHMEGYNGLIQSAESTFAFTLGAFDFDGMTGAHKFLGPIFFFLFIAVIYVGMMSIFLTIIADAFTTVKEETQNAQNEYELMDFLWRRFKGIIGVK